MIEIAVPGRLRRDQSVRDKMHAANQGDPQALGELHRRFLDTITDDTVRDLLRQSAQRQPNAPDAPDLLYRHLVTRLKEMRLTRAYPPSQVAPTNSATLTTDLEWSTLAKDIYEAAERLWRDYFLHYDSVQTATRDLHGTPSNPSAKLETLKQLTDKSRQFMHLWLEALLLRMRASSNFRARQIHNSGVGRGSRTRAQIAKTFRSYYRVLSGWDEELRKLTGQHMFRSGYFDAQQFKTISAEFASDKLHPHEDGWAAQSADAQAELRFQVKDEMRRERWRVGQRVFACWEWVLKITTGYGTRPARFIWTVATAILVFAVLFFANNALNPGKRVFSGDFFCPETRPTLAHWYDVLTIVIRYLYLAATNLSSLGSNPSLVKYCGGSGTQVLLIVTSLTGYFLLALLASLFFKQLTESE